MFSMPKTINHIELSQEDRFLEIRDIFVSALRRISQSKKSAQIPDNELDKVSYKSVYALDD